VRLRRGRRAWHAIAHAHGAAGGCATEQAEKGDALRQANVRPPAPAEVHDHGGHRVSTTPRGVIPAWQAFPFASDPPVKLAVRGMRLTRRSWSTGRDAGQNRPALREGFRRLRMPGISIRSQTSPATSKSRRHWRVPRATARADIPTHIAFVGIPAPPVRHKPFAASRINFDVRQSIFSRSPRSTPRDPGKARKRGPG
jgi:hypothetical protein